MGAARSFSYVTNTLTNEEIEVSPRLAAQDSVRPFGSSACSLAANTAFVSEGVVARADVEYANSDSARSPSVAAVMTVNLAISTPNVFGPIWNLQNTTAEKRNSSGRKGRPTKLRYMCGNLLHGRCQNGLWWMRLTGGSPAPVRTHRGRSTNLLVDRPVIRKRHISRIPGAEGCRRPHPGHADGWPSLPKADLLELREPLPHTARVTLPLPSVSWRACNRQAPYASEIRERSSK